eukprot:GHVR01089410.1.p1 GENE.GHVR01089410.1~~GHVR01089410.1.p1  ORF type:complete len:159 (+),score=61.88 GHVR01089410.1:66-542(+)
MINILILFLIVVRAEESGKPPISTCLLDNIALASAWSNEQSVVAEPLEYNINFDPLIFNYNIKLDYDSSNIVMLYGSSNTSRCVVLPTGHEGYIPSEYITVINDITNTNNDILNHTNFISKKNAHTIKNTNHTHAFTPKTSPLETHTDTHTHTHTHTI